MGTAKPLRRRGAQTGPRRSGRKVSTGGPRGRGVLEGRLPTGARMKGPGSLVLAG